MRQILSQDTLDLLAELTEADVRYLIVGGHALAVHGVSRATLDLDIFVRPDSLNAEKIIHALVAFGAPLRAHGVSKHDFEREGTIYQLGLPPNRIDILTAIDGVNFDQAWEGHVEVTVDRVQMHVIGLESIIKNKISAGRPKDLVDVAALEKIRR